jgi:hypothetical protein
MYSCLFPFLSRACQDIFMSTVGILSALVRSDEGALQVARTAPSAIKLWEGICQLLNRKMDMERRYIERLEGEWVGWFCESSFRCCEALCEIFDGQESGVVCSYCLKEVHCCTMQGSEVFSPLQMNQDNIECFACIMCWCLC